MHSSGWARYAYRLSAQALTADELLRAAGVEPSEGAPAVTGLELAGRVTFENGVCRVGV